MALFPQGLFDSERRESDCTVAMPTFGDGTEDNSHVLDWEGGREKRRGEGLIQIEMDNYFAQHPQHKQQQIGCNKTVGTVHTS